MCDCSFFMFWLAYMRYFLSCNVELLIKDIISWHHSMFQLKPANFEPGEFTNLLSTLTKASQKSFGGIRVVFGEL